MGNQVVGESWRRGSLTEGEVYPYLTVLAIAGYMLRIAIRRNCAGFATGSANAARQDGCFGAQFQACENAEEQKPDHEVVTNRKRG